MRRLIGFSTLLCALAAATWSAWAPAQTPGARGTIERRTQEVMARLLASFSKRTGAADPRYFDHGLWVTDDHRCWACSQGGPATGAATLWAAGPRGRAQLRDEALQTIDRAIADHQGPDGSFVPPPGDPQSPEVATMFFGVELGATDLALNASLDPDRRARWSSALARAADYLIAHGNLRFYTNGNVCLGNAALLYLAWRVTRAPRFSAAYETALGFALAPPQSRWPGFGLRVIRAGSSADGRDGAGYLAESGGGPPGFDPDYSALQLDVASRLYLYSGDRRVLRVANLLANALLPRIDRSWMLDTGGGTRHPQAGRRVPFLSPGLAVLAWQGGRTDLTARVSSQFHLVARTYQDALNYGSVSIYRGLGNQLSVLLRAAQAGTAGRRR
jgi:hypothetical protein